MTSIELAVRYIVNIELTSSVQLMFSDAMDLYSKREITPSRRAGMQSISAKRCDRGVLLVSDLSYVASL